MKAGEHESAILLGDPPGSDLIPLGDPPGSKGWARIQSEKEARNDPRRALSGERLSSTPITSLCSSASAKLEDGCSLRGGCSRAIA